MLFQLFGNLSIGKDKSNSCRRVGISSGTHVFKSMYSIRSSCFCNVETSNGLSFYEGWIFPGGSRKDLVANFKRLGLFLVEEPVLPFSKTPGDRMLLLKLIVFLSNQNCLVVLASTMVTLLHFLALVYRDLVDTFEFFNQFRDSLDLLRVVAAHLLICHGMNCPFESSSKD